MLIVFLLHNILILIESFFAFMRNRFFRHAFSDVDDEHQTFEELRAMKNENRCHIAFDIGLGF